MNFLILDDGIARLASLIHVEVTRSRFARAMLSITTNTLTNINNFVYVIPIFNWYILCCISLALLQYSTRGLLKTGFPVFDKFAKKNFQKQKTPQIVVFFIISP